VWNTVNYSKVILIILENKHISRTYKTVVVKHNFCIHFQLLFENLLCSSVLTLMFHFWRLQNRNIINTLNCFSFNCMSAVFTAWCYASAVLAIGLCLSVTSRSSTKTAKCRITQTTLHDSPGTLVFWCQRSPRNSTRVTPYEGAECRWGGSKSATFD